MDESGSTRHWLDDPPTVGAVLVAHNGAAWLPKVLASFANMFQAPTAWRVVDVSSTDGCADLLRDSFGAERITYAPSGTGFGEAARLGVEAMPRTDWIWLLHDDAAVLPGTLAGLLDVATSADDIAVVGPKIREWPSLRRLLEVGLTVTNTGSRETGLETGEPDAGQHDWPRDVLAVTSAGMLVRRDVWDELGGFDPALPMYFDDIDFGWRVARAGYRTRTAPGGVMFHVEASRRGNRRRTAGDVPHWEPRRAAIYTLLANTSAPHIWWQHVRLFVGSLMRVLGFLIGKDPESASDELLSLRGVYLHPLEMRAARRARAATSRRSDRDIGHLFPPFWLPYRHGFDAIRDTIVALVRPEAIETVGRRSTLGEHGPEETEDLEDGPSLLERRPWFATVLMLVGLSVIAGRGLFGGISGGSLHGGALPPAPGNAGDWWMLMWERSHEIGLGSTSIAPVFSMLLGAVATPVWFKPGIVITVLMLFAVPLAGLAAHRLGRRLTSRRGLRIVWAVSYALAVVATGAVAQGRIGTVVALIVLPIVVNTAGQLVDQPGRQLGLRLGIWISVGAAFAPVVLPLCLVGLVLLLVLEGRPVLRDGIIAALVPVVLLGPWLVQRFGHPFRVWWEAGYPVPGDASVLDLALGRAGGPGAAPAWLGIGLLVLAVLALIPRHSRVYVQVCWVVALIGLAFAVLGTAVTYSTASGPAAITPWVGVPVVVWVAGLLTAVMFAAPEIPGLPRQAVTLLAVVALVLPVGTGAWWLWRGEDDPLDKSRPAVVPAFLAERPGDTAVVTGSVARGVDVRVVADHGPFLGEEALTPDPERSAQTTSAVSRLLARASASDIRALEAVGIDAIYAPRADPEVARRIDSAPLLEPAGSDRPDSRVWTLAVNPVKSEDRAPLWRLAVSGLQVLAWVAAIIFTAPVRRRPVPEALGAEDEELVKSMSGTRVRRRTRTTLGQRLRTVSLPVIAALMLGLAFILPGGADDERPPGPVTVARSTYSCPAGDGMSLSAGQVVAGTSATAKSLPDQTSLDSLSDATTWRRDTVDATGIVMDQRGRGSGAVGFFGRIADKAAGGGLVVGSCLLTVDDSWFVGAGSGGKHLSTLVLSNLSSSPAVADLSFWGPQGKIDAIDADGIVVDPFTVRRVDLRDLAAGEADLAVRVERRRGSLAVAVLDSSTAVFQGTDALEPTLAPRRDQIVGGMPSGTGTRTLLLVNPSSSTARVAVQVVGRKGTFAPKGLESVKVDAGRFTEVTVPRSAGTDGAAMRLRSDQPVAASVRVAPNTKDRAVTEAMPLLAGSAVVPVDLGVGTGAPGLVLTALGRAGRVRLEAFDAKMDSLATTEVSVDADTTKTVDLGSREVLDAKDVAYVVARADGAVAGAATYRRGSGIASLGLIGAPVTVLGPQVRPNS